SMLLYLMSTCQNLGLVQRFHIQVKCWQLEHSLIGQMHVMGLFVNRLSDPIKMINALVVRSGNIWSSNQMKHEKGVACSISIARRCLRIDREADAVFTSLNKGWSILIEHDSTTVGVDEKILNHRTKLVWTIGANHQRK